MSASSSENKIKIKIKYKDINDFLFKNRIKKEDQPAKLITNTRIGDKDANIYGGSYHVSTEEYFDVFLPLYYRDVIAKSGLEYLTEKQLDKGGPILVDLDFRFDYDVTERLFTPDHVEDLVLAYLDELKTIFQFDGSTQIDVFVFEKPRVNRVAEKKLTKDGIHLIIGLQMDHEYQKILRKRVMEKIKEAWGDLPITNSWEDVFDDGITAGTTNWQFYGSRKPGNDAYSLSTVYRAKYDPEDEEWQIPTIPTSEILTPENFKVLSVRYPNHPTAIYKTRFLEANKQGSGLAVVPLRRVGSGGLEDCENDFVMPLQHVRTREQINIILGKFLDSISPADYELREAHDYTMTLPESYYGEGSYNKWMRVGWALRNISNKLLIVWLAFSAQYSKFDFSSVPDICERWAKINRNNYDGLTKRSIMYWSKQDVPDKYNKVRMNSVDYYIDQTLETITLDTYTDKNKKPSGSGEYDIATVLFHMFKDEYVCSNIKQNTWYRFKNHRWVEDKTGTTLRKAISTELRDLYHGKANLILQKASGTDLEDEKTKIMRNRASKVLEICQRLGRTNEKKNIMSEAKDLFYDPDFLQKVDMNPYLLCFNNGVVDFKEKTFRRGYPEDFLSKCTNIDYVVNTDPKYKKIVDEILDFMYKLFPKKELEKYMWDHLSSTLIGTCPNQTFNMYIGVGQNGKSVLVNLMDKVLGDYKAVVPLTLITNGRTKIGGVAPEVAALKGVRYAVMQEPNKGDKINEGIMKELTGGDPITARGLYAENAITFRPQLKLVVCSNEFMEIKSQDHGTWRRIRVVDFVSLFTENPRDDDPEKPYQFKLDKNITEKFESWKEVFASLLVDRAYLTNGMVEDNPIVMASSNSYKESQDFISEFIRDKIIQVTDQNKKIGKTELNKVFAEWYQDTYGRGGPSVKDVYTYMDKKFAKAARGSGWSGCMVKYEREEYADMCSGDDIGSITSSEL